MLTENFNPKHLDRWSNPVLHVAFPEYVEIRRGYFALGGQLVDTVFFMDNRTSNSISLDAVDVEDALKEEWKLACLVSTVANYLVNMNVRVCQGEA